MASEETDVEMENAETETRSSDQDMVTSEPNPDLLTIKDIEEHVRLIEKSVTSKESRYVKRVLRALASTRKRLNARILAAVISNLYTQRGAEEKRDALLAFIGGSMETSGVTNVKPKRVKLLLLPEVDIYFHLLTLLHLIDSTHLDLALSCSNCLVQKIEMQNRRTLDSLAAKCYFYHTRIHELTGTLRNVRTFLHCHLRTATLKKDSEGQAVLLNCLLRNYLHYNLYDQAFKLVSKSVFPETASNNEWSRFLYYLGVIQAIRLDYSEAHRNLMQAVRKAPQHTAVGFKQSAYKFIITVELLLGDIPDRSLFRQPTLQKALLPYFQLTCAVKAGDLSNFSEVLENFGPKFLAHGTNSLILRLRHCVIKTGIRTINLSYSRIRLSDIAQKLQLDQDTEFIVAKAIRDGVIEASIDHVERFLKSKEIIDLYCTKEPTGNFHHRISFCLDIHNQCVKGMMYPPKLLSEDLKSAKEWYDQEQQDLEFLKELEDDDFL